MSDDSNTGGLDMAFRSTSNSNLNHEAINEFIISIIENYRGISTK